MSLEGCIGLEDVLEELESVCRCTDFDFACQAQVGINTVGLEGVLYLMGIEESLWSAPEGIQHAFPLVRA